MTLLSNLFLRFREQQGAGIVQVVPDFASHADTGLDVESAAKSMQECSVQKTLGSQEYETPDDTSVVVREPPNSDYRKKALKLWTKRVEQERGLPPVRVEDNEDLFISLNNEDFFQSTQHSDGECRMPSIILKEKLETRHSEDAEGRRHCGYQEF